MRVTVICDVLGEANNGTTLAALNLIRYLREKGHTVTVVAPGKQTDIAHIEVPILNLGSFCNAIYEKMASALPKWIRISSIRRYGGRMWFICCCRFHCRGQH